MKKTKGIIIIILLIILTLTSCDWFDENKCQKIRLSKEYIDVKDSESKYAINITTYNIDGKQRDNTDIEWIIPSKIIVLSKTRNSLEFRIDKSGTYVIKVKDKTNTELERSVVVRFNNKCHKVVFSKKLIKVKDSNTLNILNAKTFNDEGSVRKNTDISWKIPKEITVINKTKDEIIFKPNSTGVFIIKGNDKTNKEVDGATIISYAKTLEEEEDNLSLIDLYFGVLGWVISK